MRSIGCVVVEQSLKKHEPEVDPFVAPGYDRASSSFEHGANTNSASARRARSVPSPSFAALLLRARACSERPPFTHRLRHPQRMAGSTSLHGAHHTARSHEPR
jgi:hypothetical protein